MGHSKTIYEGTKVVKTVKLQRLTSIFKEIRMEEDETFDEFYAKLKDIVNFAFNLGESMAEFRIVRKILWSLPERFHAKITAIEEVKDIDQIHLTELVGNLQTYEMRLGLMGKGGKSTNLAFKGIEVEIEDFEDEDESEDEDEDDDKDEDLTFITDEIIKFLQFKKKGKGKPPRKSKSSRKGKNKKPLIQCHECPNCLMKEKTKESKDKDLVATWSDTENDSSDEYMDECSHVMAFAASIDKVIMENASDSEDSSDDEVPNRVALQEAYDKLCIEFIKSEKTSHLYRKELNEVKIEKVDLLVKLDKATRLFKTLVVQNTSLEEKVKNLEVELSQARTQIERMTSEKFDKVLSARKPSSDKTGLGYDVSSGPSSSTASGSRTVFVPKSEKGDKCMKFKTDLANYKSFVRPNVCHHYGVYGHIRLNCFKLYPQKQVSKQSQVSI